MEEVKERLREAVDLGEQQLRVVEQKDDEFTKLKLEIQQMIAEKDKTIRDLKKQLASQSSSSELEMSQLQQEVASKTETLEELEKELRRLEIIQGSSLEAGGDAVNLVNILRDQLRVSEPILPTPLSYSIPVGEGVFIVTLLFIMGC